MWMNGAIYAVCLLFARVFINSATGSRAIFCTSFAIAQTNFSIFHHIQLFIWSFGHFENSPYKHGKI